MARVLTPEDVLNATFTQTQFRAGYDEREVDEFLDAVAARHPAGSSSGPVAEGAVTAPGTAARESFGAKVLRFLRGESC